MIATTKKKKRPPQLPLPSVVVKDPNEIECYWIRGGFWVLVCYRHDWYAPVATVLGLEIKSQNGKRIFHVYDSHVNDCIRRKGIRTSINTYLFDEKKIDVIATVSGSDPLGTSFMDGSGYIVDRTTGLYQLTKAKHKKVQRAKTRKAEAAKKGE